MKDCQYVLIHLIWKIGNKTWLMGVLERSIQAVLVIQKKYTSLEYNVINNYRP